MNRYFIPFNIGIQLAVAYLLAHKIYLSSVSLWQQKIWKIIIVLLISAGLLSCAVSSQAETWWNKRVKYPDLKIFDVINSAPKPLLISPSLKDSLVFSHELESKVKVLIITSSDVPKIPDNFSDIFLIDYSQNLKNQLEKSKNYKITMAYKGRRRILWKLENIFLSNRA
jgi:uncharacterized membrane protein